MQTLPIFRSVHYFCGGSWGKSVSKGWVSFILLLFGFWKMYEVGWIFLLCSYNVIRTLKNISKYTCPEGDIKRYLFRRKITQHLHTLEENHRSRAWQQNRRARAQHGNKITEKGHGTKITEQGHDKKTQRWQGHDS